MSNPQRGGFRGRGGPPRGRGSPAPSSYSGSGRGDGGNRGGFRGGPGGGGPRGGSRGSGGGGGGFRGPPPAAEVFAAGTPARVDARLSSLDALVQSFSNLRVGPEMPARPGFGTAGTATVVRANFFALKYSPKLLIYDYEVVISPSSDLRGPRKARIFDLLEGSPECAPFRGYIAHDRSARLVSVRKLPQPLTTTIQFFEEGAPGPNDRSPTYAIEIKLTRTLKANDITP